MVIKSPKEDFAEVTDDLKLRTSLSVLADKYDAKIREKIYRVYNG